VKVLAGDIGGTKTLLRIAEVHGTQVEVLHEARYLSQDYPLFDSLLADYLREASTLTRGISRGCFGVAGPIRQEQGYRTAQITHLPWLLDERKLSALSGIPAVGLINDFEAIGFGVAGLAPQHLHTLQEGDGRAGDDMRLIVGAGTGLGVAQLLRHGNRTRVLASQGGHVGYAPGDALEDALLHYLRPREGRVSWEHVVSGPGLVRLYDFLYHYRAYHDDQRYRSVMGSDDPSAAVSAAAADGDELSTQTLALFVRLYGRVSGDLALASLAFGGVYLAGGIAPKILSMLATPVFIEAFRDKGPMTPLMSAFPVAVITDTHIGATGAALYAAEQLGQQ